MGPAIIREALSTTLVCPGQTAEVGPFGEIVIESGMSATETTSRRTRFATSATRSSRRRYGCDRFTATVLANRFQYIVEHMCARLLTAAFSPILRDFYDFAATLTGPPEIDYPTPAMSNSIVLFTGDDDRVRATHGRGVRRRAPRAG